MAKIFSNFDEIENDLRAEAPSVVYKYRTWKDDNHKNLLINQEVWFSHPFHLNDPLDVRPATEFNVAEFHDERYLGKLMASVGEARPHLTSDTERKAEAEAQWERIKANPAIILENHKHRIADARNFDQFGVFSTSMNALSTKTWDEYGDHNAGYCIGFKTVEFCREINSIYCYVQYSDEPYKYSFFNKQNEMDILNLKKTSWAYEEEFRFVTVGIGVYTERKQRFSVNAVAEIILGYNISAQDEVEIFKIIEEKYPKDLPIYKIEKRADGTLVKNKLNK